MNKNSKRTAPSRGFKVKTGVPVNSSKLRKDSGRKPWVGLTSKSKGRIGYLAPSQD